MVIFASDNKLRRAITDPKARQKLLGADMAKKLELRLATLLAAESLADFWPPKSGSERCHELIGDMAGVFSIDLKQPYRLLFRPVDSPQRQLRPQTEESDEQLRWAGIKAIDIVAIEDTHG
jgi:plasmid maintenance system killer protein